MASLTFSFNAQSQNGPSGLAISHMPKQANGFLILDKNINPTVTHWKVEISRISYDSTSTNNPFIFSTVERIDMRGTNYMKIDDTYLNNSQYFLRAKGYNASNIEVVEEGPLPICPECPTSFNSCTWGCVGKTYAYGLDLWVAPNGGSSFLTMKTITPTNRSYPYYYEWVKSINWQNFSLYNPNGAGYYNLSSINYVIGDSRIIKLENITSNDNLFDASNSLCTGTVYGIRKQYGPWSNAYGALGAPYITGGQSNCNQNFSWAMGKVNSNTAQFTQYNVPTLSCNGNSFSPTGGTSNPIENPIAHDFAPCYEWFEEAFTGENGNLYVVLSQTNGCITSSNPPNPNGQTVAFEWPNNIVAATIKSSTGADPIVLMESTLFDTDGNFIGLPIELSRGFYNAGIQFSDNSYASVFFERTTPISSGLTLSNFLNTNIYAVPIQGNSFTMDLGATARVKFEYSLYDANANLLHQNNYLLEKDTQMSELITVEDGIPSGILINKFKFSDGSEITFQTIK